jgi:DNA-binding transcriptional ArsR family regulator
VSHQATSWAIRQRGLKPATKLVLWQLCDRYHPDHGCFPSQETLADDCEMSRASVNRHLDELEQRGLIRRIRRSTKKTHRQQSTLYILAFQPEMGSEPSPKTGDGHGENTLNSLGKLADPTPKTGDGVGRKPCRKLRHGAVSQKTQKPCLKNGKSRVSNCDTNLVKEPVIENARGKKPYFTDAERSEARLVVDHLGGGGTVRFDAVGWRVLECLIAEKMLSEGHDRTCRDLMAERG